MNSDSVDLVATDPPFNTGRALHAAADTQAAGVSFRDRWSWDDGEGPVHHPGARAAIEGARQTHSDGMGAFVRFLALRVVEMHRVLAPTGSIYLHADPTASHYLKALLDAVFGFRNFRNEIIWSYGLGGSSRRRFSRKHDVILFYTKSGDYHFDKPRTAATSNRMAGRSKGMLDVWTDIAALNNMAAERTGWPTQKPLALYERIVEASSAPGDMVLDPFAGSGTTLVAAERLGRQWVGVDIEPRAHCALARRLERDLAVPAAAVRAETGLPAHLRR